MNSPILRILITGSLGALVVFWVTPANAATCPKEPLKTSPMRLGDFTNILPLGNFNPPDHTIPTDHIYFSLADDGSGIIPVKNVYAPADITITNITATTYYQDTTKIAEDYSIMFSVCNQLTGRFGHVSSLTAAIKSKLTKWDRCQTYAVSSVGNKVKSCSKQIKLTVKNGVKIGTVGGKISHALDLWAYDTRVNIRASFANPLRYTNTGIFSTTCPVSYFTAAVQKKLVPMLGGQTAARTKSPRCGTFAPDKLGTLRGNWFYGNAKDEPNGWKKELSLAYDNRDGITGVISIGGVVTTAGIYSFTPLKTGLINRSFETVTPGDTLYCYQSESNSVNSQFIIQLVDAKTLKIERQDGPCVAPFAFTKPILYKR